jgi:hypothetical protein
MSRPVNGPVPAQTGFPPEGYTSIEKNMRDQTFQKADMTSHDGAGKAWKPMGRKSWHGKGLQDWDDQGQGQQADQNFGRQVQAQEFVLRRIKKLDNSKAGKAAPKGGTKSTDTTFIFVRENKQSTGSGPSDSIPTAY